MSPIIPQTEEAGLPLMAENKKELDGTTDWPICDSADRVTTLRGIKFTSTVRDEVLFSDFANV